MGDRGHRAPRVRRGEARLDAGTLCGEDPVGADCVLYMPRSLDLDNVVELLESGTNIVTTRGELFGGGRRLGDEGRAEVLAACRRGGSPIYATGSSSFDADRSSYLLAEFAPPLAALAEAAALPIDEWTRRLAPEAADRASLEMLRATCEWRPNERVSFGRDAA